MTGGRLTGAEATVDSVAPAAGPPGTIAGGMLGALAVGAGAAAAIAAMTGGGPEAGGGTVGFSGISRRMLPKAAVAAQPRPQTPNIV
jgi:hypothetical protein